MTHPKNVELPLTTESAALYPYTVNLQSKAERVRNKDQDMLAPSRSPLRRGVTFKAVVSTRAQDLVGNVLDQRPDRPGDQPKVWYFTMEE
jgi:hypothetical protein